MGGTEGEGKSEVGRGAKMCREKKEMEYGREQRKSICPTT